jgi:hypothetical protein
MPGPLWGAAPTAARFLVQSWPTPEEVSGVRFAGRPPFTT